jgi:hypothetical protein
MLVGDAAGVEGAVASAPPDTAGKSSRNAVEVKIVMGFMSQLEGHISTLSRNCVSYSTE